MVCNTPVCMSTSGSAAAPCPCPGRSNERSPRRLRGLIWCLLLCPLLLLPADGWQPPLHASLPGAQPPPSTRPCRGFFAMDLNGGAGAGGQHEQHQQRRRDVVIPHATMMSAPDSRIDLRKGGGGEGKMLGDPETSFKADKPLAGRPHTPESRAKISAANKGKTPWNQGKRHSEATKARIREKTKLAMEARRRAKLAELGMTLEEYDEMKQMQAAAEKERRRLARKNMTVSDDFRSKLSERMREQWKDPEYRAKALKHLNESRALQTEETRKKISETMKAIWEQQRFSRNRTITEETRKKISEKLKAMYADPEYRSKLTQARRRDPEHNKKIAEAIRRKWAEAEYKNKTLTAIQSYQQEMQIRLETDPEGAAAKRSRAPRSSSSSSSSPSSASRPRTKRATSASRKRLIEAELQELDRLDREMRGEIRPRKVKKMMADRPAATQIQVKEMVEQAQNIWDQIYSETGGPTLEHRQSYHAATGRGGGADQSESRRSSSIKKVLEVLHQQSSNRLYAQEGGAQEGEEEEDGEEEDEAGLDLSSDQTEEELDESELDWRRHLQLKAKSQLEELELKARIKEARSRVFDEGPVATEMFQLVNGKVAVLPAPPEALPVDPLPSPAPPDEAVMMMLMEEEGEEAEVVDEATSSPLSSSPSSLGKVKGKGALWMTTIEEDEGGEEEDSTSSSSGQIDAAAA